VSGAAGCSDDDLETPLLGRRTSHGISRASSVLTACDIESQSDLDPMTTPTNGFDIEGPHGGKEENGDRDVA
jgi:hypothetical protein